MHTSRDTTLAQRTLCSLHIGIHDIFRL